MFNYSVFKNYTPFYHKVKKMSTFLYFIATLGAIQKNINSALSSHEGGDEGELVLIF